MTIHITANGESPDGFGGDFTYSTSSSNLPPSVLGRDGAARASYSFDDGHTGMTADVPTPLTRFVAKWFSAYGHDPALAENRPFTRVFDGVNERIQTKFVRHEEGYYYVSVSTVDGENVVELFTSSKTHEPMTNLGFLNPKGDFILDINYVEEGWVKLYFGEKLVGEFLGDPRVGGSTSLNRINLRGPKRVGIWSNAAFTNIMVADEDLVGKFLITQVPNANGFENNWTGSFGNINNTGMNANFMSSDVADQGYLFNCSDVPTVAGRLTISGVVLKSYASRGAAGPTDVQQRIRVGSNNYNAPAQYALGFEKMVVEDFWQKNPANDEAWTISDLNALQIGSVSKGP